MGREVVEVQLGDCPPPPFVARIWIALSRWGSWGIRLGRSEPYPPIPETEYCKLQSLFLQSTNPHTPPRPAHTPPPAPLVRTTAVLTEGTDALSLNCLEADILACAILTLGPQTVL